MRFAQRSQRFGRILKTRIFAWLFIRVTAIWLFVPVIQSALFVPFLDGTHNHILDPWGNWLNAGGRIDAFPYGPMMYICFLPATYLFKLVGEFLGTSSLTSIQLSICFTMLVLDFGIVYFLGVFKEKNHTYWSWLVLVSPLAIFISFIHGQVDLVPAFFLFIAIREISRRKWFRVGLFLGIGIAAKFSLALVLPFILIYFISTHSQIKNMGRFVYGLSIPIILGFSPYLWSKGFRTMVLGTPETLKSFSLGISVGKFQVPLILIAYVLLFIWFWNLNRISAPVLQAFIGSSMLAIAGCQTSSVGWFWWGLPIIFLILKQGSSRTLFLVLAWQLTSIFVYLPLGNTTKVRFTSTEITLKLTTLQQNLFFSLNLILLVTIIAKVLMDAVTNSDRFALAKSPLAVSISGDSGVGKDSLTKSLASYLGEENSAILLGDDYHLYERGDISWLAITHLNPDANDLDLMRDHFRQFMRREKVVARHYDHAKGRFTLPREILPSDLIVINGLHAQLVTEPTDLDLKIFLSMDEDLRVKFKADRDLNERGHADFESILKSIKARESDYFDFVHPQAQSADLHFNVQALTIDPVRTLIHVRCSSSSYLRSLYATLMSITSCPVKINTFSGQVSLEVDAANFQASDSKVIIEALLPSADQLLSNEASYIDGDMGFMAATSLILLGKRRLASGS